MEQIGFSDHLTIEICIQEITNLGSALQGSASMGIFRSGLEILLRDVENSVKLIKLMENIKQLSEELQTIITDASKNTPVLREAIKKRNQLRKKRK